MPEQLADSSIESYRTHLTPTQIRGIMLDIAREENEMKAPGRHSRKSIDVFEASEMFSTESKAEEWFIQTRCNGDVRCPKCNSDNIRRNDKVRMSMRFFCRPCRRYFSVKSGTVMHDSKLPLRKWGWILYENSSTNLKGISAMKMHRSIRISYKSAWSVGHKVRAYMVGGIPEKFNGPVQVDEAFIGGKAKNMSASRWKKLKGMGLLGGGSNSKVPVIGMRDDETGMVRATTLPSVQRSTVQPFIEKHTHEDTVVFSDEARYYNGLNRPHGRVNHKKRTYVDGEITTNGIESLWSTIKKAISATYHNVSPKHVDRYVDEFVGRHNTRPLDTIDQMTEIVRNMEGRRLTVKELTAWTGDNRYTVIVE